MAEQRLAEPITWNVREVGDLGTLPRFSVYSPYVLRIFSVSNVFEGLLIGPLDLGFFLYKRKQATLVRVTFRYIKSLVVLSSPRGFPEAAPGRGQAAYH